MDNPRDLGQMTGLLKSLVNPVERFKIGQSAREAAEHFTYLRRLQGEGLHSKVENWRPNQVNDCWALRGLALQNAINHNRASSTRADVSSTKAKYRFSQRV